MLIDIEKVKVSDRIRKDYGDLQELADDIKENGLINPPVVTPDNYELIAGERRLRAMKLLGYKQIEVRPMAVKDAEHALNLEISENETRKDFSKAERIDYARRLERVESLKARERMLSTQNNDTAKSASQISDRLGRTDDLVSGKLNIGSRDTYRKEKFIVDNKSSLPSQDFADWDEGKLSTNKAFNKIKKEKEQLENKIKELESTPPKIINNTDYSKIQKLENEISKLKTENKKLETTTPLNNSNTDLINKINNLQKEKENLELLNKTLKSSKEATEKLMDTYKGESEEYTKIKNNIAKLGLQPDGDYNILDLSSNITTLTDEIEELLTTKLSPIRYMKILPVIKSNNALKRNMENLIYMVDDWCKSMVDTIGLNENKNIIDMEEMN